MAIALAGFVGCVRPSVTDRARALVREHRDVEALAVLRDALGRDPKNIEARRLLIRVLASDGDMVRAREEVDVLSRVLPAGDPSADIELGHALELAHRYDEALEAYDAAADAAPRSPQGPLEGGMRCARWGEAAAAKPRLEEAIRRGADGAEVWHVLGLVRLNLGDLSGAEEAYRNGTKADAGNPVNWLGLASVAVARSDPAHALVAYDQVLARSPRYAAGELGRAWALAKLGRRKEAEQALDRARDLGAPEASIAREQAALGDPALNK